MALKTRHAHFSEIASKYRNLRSTDIEPIEYICSKLDSLPKIHAVDVGCGAGRYDYLLFKGLGEDLRLTCVDENKAMLAELSNYLTRHRIERFRAVAAPADKIPAATESLDCVLTFNAVHHFPIDRFLNESRRVLKPGGLMFIYTRTRSQNSRSVWGAHFPDFATKEHRLCEVDEMAAAVLSVDGLLMEEARAFVFQRSSNLERLLEQAENHHYSTLALYEAPEFDDALLGFHRGLNRIQESSGVVSWNDENTLFVIRNVA